MATIAVDGTTLYYELRGDGPPVMFISGATGDAGHWAEVGEALAGDHTVLSYDRRANSRSPAPTTGSRRRSTNRPTMPPPSCRDSASLPPSCTATARVRSS